MAASIRAATSGAGRTEGKGPLVGPGQAQGHEDGEDFGPVQRRRQHTTQSLGPGKFHPADFLLAPIRDEVDPPDFRRGGGGWVERIERHRDDHLRNVVVLKTAQVLREQPDRDVVVASEIPLVRQIEDVGGLGLC